MKHATILAVLIFTQAMATGAVQQPGAAKPPSLTLAMELHVEVHTRVARGVSD